MAVQRIYILFVHNVVFLGQNKDNELFAASAHSGNCYCAVCYCAARTETRTHRHTRTHTNHVGGHTRGCSGRQHKHRYARTQTRTHTYTNVHLPRRMRSTRHARGCRGTGRAGAGSRRSGRGVAGEAAATAPRPRTPTIHMNNGRLGGVALGVDS